MKIFSMLRLCLPNLASHTIVCAAVLVMSIVTTRSQAGPKNLLDLGNNEILRGTAEGFSNGILNWHHALSDTRFPVAASEIHRLFFAAQATPLASAGDTILLANGDLLTGRLDNLDAQSATISDTLAGTLVLPRKELRSARLASSESTVAFLDAGDLVGWKSSSPNGSPIEWKSLNNTLSFSGRSSETLARTVRIPDSSEVSLDLAWDANPLRQPQFAILVCANNEKPEQSTDHYSFNVTSSMVTALRMSDIEGEVKQSVLGRVQIGGFLRERQSLRLQTIIDRPGRHITLLINGRFAARWSDPVVPPPSGSVIQLAGYPGVGLRLRNLKVESWNGLVDGQISSDNAHPDADTVVINDGDTPIGTILGIKRHADGKRQVEMTISFNKSKPLLIDVPRIRQIFFANPKLDTEQSTEPASVPRPTVVHLIDGTRLSATTLAFDAEKMHLTTRTHQNLTIPANTLLNIEFPSYQPPANAKVPLSSNEENIFEP